MNQSPAYIFFKYLLLALASAVFFFPVVILIAVAVVDIRRAAHLRALVCRVTPEVEDAEWLARLSKGVQL